jgi:hypothetical protein
VVDSPLDDDPFVSVRDIARLAGTPRTKVYAAARANPDLLPLDPNHKGVRSSFAFAWLKAKVERDAARAASHAEAAFRKAERTEAARQARVTAKRARRAAVVENLRRLREEAIEQVRKDYEARYAASGGDK